MHQLRLGTIKIPKIYVCESQAEAEEPRRLGIPYLIRPDGWDDRKLAAACLWTMLNEKFPHVDWARMFGLPAYDRLELNVEVPYIVEKEAGLHEWEGDNCGHSGAEMQQSDGYREYTGGGGEADLWKERDIEEYLGDIGWQVKIEELQALSVLPTFLDDISTAVRRNLQSQMWMDGWNKKLQAPLGSFTMGADAPNLIILDVSSSIPHGVAATMVSLIETLRSQANADLIITSSTSIYIRAGEPLPSMRKLGGIVGGGNEATQFYTILNEHVFGKHWGNVIVFGDNDSPEWIADYELRYGRTHLPEEDRRWVPNSALLAATTVDNVLAFHTYYQQMPGYGRWCNRLPVKPEVTINTDWVRWMK